MPDSPSATLTTPDVPPAPAFQTVSVESDCALPFGLCHVSLMIRTRPYTGHSEQLVFPVLTALYRLSDIYKCSRLEAGSVAHGPNSGSLEPTTFLPDFYYFGLIQKY